MRRKARYVFTDLFPSLLRMYDSGLVGSIVRTLVLGLRYR